MSTISFKTFSGSFSRYWNENMKVLFSTHIFQNMLKNKIYFHRFCPKIFLKHSARHFQGIAMNYSLLKFVCFSFAEYTLKIIINSTQLGLDEAHRSCLTYCPNRTHITSKWLEPPHLKLRWPQSGSNVSNAVTKCLKMTLIASSWTQMGLDLAQVLTQSKLLVPIINQLGKLYLPHHDIW